MKVRLRSVEENASAAIERSATDRYLHGLQVMRNKIAILEDEIEEYENQLNDPTKSNTMRIALLIVLDVIRAITL